VISFLFGGPPGLKMSRSFHLTIKEPFAFLSQTSEKLAAPFSPLPKDGGNFATLSYEKWACTLTSGLIYKFIGCEAQGLEALGRPQRLVTDASTISIKELNAELHRFGVEENMLAVEVASVKENRDADMLWPLYAKDRARQLGASELIKSSGRGRY
jgi:hypothetical protein